MPSLFFSLKKLLPEDMVKNLKNNTILDTVCHQDTNSLSSMACHLLQMVCHHLFKVKNIPYEAATPS